MLLRDPDYRVRFFLARRLGVLFQTWDGHEELFQDIWYVLLKNILYQADPCCPTLWFPLGGWICISSSLLILHFLLVKIVVEHGLCPSALSIQFCVTYQGECYNARTSLMTFLVYLKLQIMIITRIHELSLSFSSHQSVSLENTAAV